MKQCIFNFDSGDNVFLTSDSHFSHSNIITFCNRPFASVEEMDQTLIDNWNKVVGSNDYIFHLGDFCFKGSQRWDELLNQLNGHKFLILGNHDMSRIKDGAMYKFDWVGMQAYLTIGGRTIYLNHYPFLCYGGTYRSEENAVIQAFGHVHSCLGCIGKDWDRLQYLFPTQYDVGVDVNNFTPISATDLITKVKEQIIHNTNQYYWLKDIKYAKDKKEI